MREETSIAICVIGNYISKKINQPHDTSKFSLFCKMGENLWIITLKENFGDVSPSIMSLIFLTNFAILKWMIELCFILLITIL